MIKRRGSRAAAPRTHYSLTIRWTDRARNDLIEIGDFIAKDNTEAAARWVDTLITTVERLAVFPLSGRVVPELAKDVIREIIRHPYRIVYKVGDRTIDILTVFEGHRRLPAGVVPDDQGIP